MTVPVRSTPDQLSEQLVETIRRLQRIRWAAVGALAAIVVAAILLGGYVLVREHRQLEASCQFMKDVGTVPVVVTPPSKRPSELGVALVWHAREAFTGQDCPGRLPPASASLLKWAGYYHLSPPAASINMMHMTGGTNP